MFTKFIHILSVVFLISVKATEQGLLKQERIACIVPCQANEQSSKKDQEKITVLTFYVEQKVEQAEDFIQMSLTLKQKETSLKKAVDLATRKVQSIKKSCQDYCIKNKGQNCQGRVEVDNFQVEAAYQSVRRQPIFNGFVVTHKIKIIVLETKNVGQLVDILLNLGLYQIDSLQWKPNVQVDVMQKAIDAGISKGTELCKHINRKIGAILSINEIFDENQDDENDDGQDQGKSNDQDEEQQEPSILKFQVECVGNIGEQQEIIQKPNQKAGKKKKKKQKK